MNPILCQALDDYLALDLPEAERRRFEAHLPDCPACREAVRENRRLDGLLGEALARLRKVPETLPERVRVRIGRAERNRRIGIAVAASILAVGAWALLRVVPTPAPTPEPIEAKRPEEKRPTPETTAAPRVQVTFPDSAGTIGVPVASDSEKFTFIRVYKGLRHVPDVADVARTEASPDNDRSDP